MKKYILTSVIILLFGVSLNAQNVQSVSSVAVVDIKLIVEKSKAAVSLAKQLQDVQGKYQKDIKKIETSLKEKEEKLVKQKSIIEESVYEKKAKEFQQEVFEANQEVKKKRSKLEKAYLKGLEQIRSVTLDIISEIARQNKYTIVMPKSQLLYSEKSSDISEQVLSRLDSKLSNVKLNIE